MDNLDMFSGEETAQADNETKLSSYTAVAGDIECNSTGIIIPWAKLMELLAHKETTKSGKELKAYITIPRGVLKNGNKPMNKIRFGIGCFVKP